MILKIKRITILIINYFKIMNYFMSVLATLHRYLFTVYVIQLIKMQLFFFLGLVGMPLQLTDYRRNEKVYQQI